MRKKILVVMHTEDKQITFKSLKSTSNLCFTKLNHKNLLSNTNQTQTSSSSSIKLQLERGKKFNIYLTYI